MDKNTVIGLVLIAGLMFGFMLCRNDQTTAKQEATKTEKTSDAPGEKENIAGVTATDSTFHATLGEKVRSYGEKDDAGTSTLVTGPVMLSVDSVGNINGTVRVEGKAVDVSAVLSPEDSSIAPEDRAKAVALLRDEMASMDRYGDFAGFLGGSGESLTLENKSKTLRVTFNTLGGRIERVVLPGYRTETTTPATDICLMEPKTGGYEFEFETASQRISTANLNFKAEKVNDTTIVMTLPLANGASFGLRYTVTDDYVVTMDMLQSGMDKVIPTNRTTMRLKWHQDLRRNEKGRTFEERNSAIYYKFDGENPDDLNANGDESESLTGNIKWVAFKNQFFSSVLIAKGHLATADLTSTVVKNSDVLKKMDMNATFDYSSVAKDAPSFAFYFGPNSYPLLSDMDDVLASYRTEGDDLELKKLVPLGWGIFGWINRFVVIPVFSFLSGYIRNYGIIILLLTLFIKLILFPLTYKSYMSQAKMRVLQPEIKEINDKYPGQENAMKRQQETMKLYSRAGASPFSGCLPMMLQMPVLIAMFSFFPSAIELRGQSFLWVHDLSAPDYIFSLPFSIPFLGNQLSLFCLLMTVVNIIYTRINMQNQPTSTSMPGMKWMMYLMPVMFLFFFNDYAAGLSYYYFVSLLITIIQTYAFRWFVDEKKVRAEMLENAKKPRKKGGLMARLEAAQKKQEAMMREQAKQRRR